MNNNNDNEATSVESPMTFRAGGGGGMRKGIDRQRRHAEEKKDDASPPSPSASLAHHHTPTTSAAARQRQSSSSSSPSPSSEIRRVDDGTSSGIGSSSSVVPASESRLFPVIRSGLSRKRSPFEVKNWIACLLTLDGRDKFTKVLQYTSRMLCWYFAGLARRTIVPGIDGPTTTTGRPIDASGGIRGAASLVVALYSDLDVRRKYYLAISRRFEELYKSLVTSRKAYRIGRSIIEWDKISSMGVGEYLNYMLLEPLADSPGRTHGDATDATAPIPPSSVTSTPGWKLLGTTAKLVGLMGFWAFDNASFVAGSGFLDPIISDDRVVLVDPKCPERTSRKNRAAEWASRFYFMGSVGGLYVNARSLWVHRRNELRMARERLRVAIAESTGIEDAKSHLIKTEGDNFELCVALLKSIADVTVFSNNPGVDLHLKYRGKKNHEGLHCLGGLISASTVLYNNFPNA
ncbi:hypothetical protein ACHAXA_011037 [Cyclostephanos tholiformis]|uniref:Uncharacterized protein n=1 Tax=Cyclostephanos tholiformis TaxID=382380 RepID=A0ABD3RZ16_9STRA